MNSNDFSTYIACNGWSNSACIGYVIIVCKNLGYAKAQISELVEMLNATFSNYSFEETEKEYNKF